MIFLTYLMRLASVIGIGACLFVLGVWLAPVLAAPARPVQRNQTRAYRSFDGQLYRWMPSHSYRRAGRTIYRRGEWVPVDRPLRLTELV